MSFLSVYYEFILFSMLDFGIFSGIVAGVLAGVLRQQQNK
jgi:hypothetical protein